MSPKRDKTVSQLVEKYSINKQTCNLDRDLMRRLIRVEHPELFKDNASNLRKLDRCLAKVFKDKKKWRLSEGDWGVLFYGTKEDVKEFKK